MESLPKVWKFCQVDDGEDDYIILREQLKKIFGSGFELDWFPDTTNIVASIISGKYDAVFIEYIVGPINGLDIIRAIRAVGATVPILMATDWVIPDQELRDMAAEAGANFFVAKQEANTALLKQHLHQVLPGLTFQA